MAVDHVGERVCPECGGEVDDVDWLPFCSNTCWSSFQEASQLPGAEPQPPGGVTR